MDPAELCFTVDHRGRSGTLTISGAVAVECQIELMGDGSFAVHLRGANTTERLSAETRSQVREALRRWLDDSQRADWSIEG